MTPRFLWLSLIGVLAAFGGGFLLANALNRAEIADLRATNARIVQASNSAKPSDTALSNEEIRSKISEADADPTNFRFQRDLGLALYRYGSIKKDTAVLAESARILDRAVTIQPTDRTLIIAKGNAHFDLGYFNRDNSELENARRYYTRALDLKDDADVRTDLGLTYFLYDPPDMARSVEEFRRALSVDPKHEKALQFMVQAMSKQQKHTEARQYLAKLREVNPQNETISELSAMLDDLQDKPVQ